MFVSVCFASQIYLEYFPYLNNRLFVCFSEIKRKQMEVCKVAAAMKQILSTLKRWVVDVLFLLLVSLLFHYIRYIFFVNLLF